MHGCKPLRLSLNLAPFRVSSVRSPGVGCQLYTALPNNAQAAAKVVMALVRMEQGNLSNTKGVGIGVFECWIDFGPGYRVYFGKAS